MRFNYRSQMSQLTVTHPKKEKDEKNFVIDAKKHLTVQNTRLSLDAMYGHLSSFLGYKATISASTAAAE